jgi:hypothetical protein
MSLVQTYADLLPMGEGILLSDGSITTWSSLLSGIVGTFLEASSDSGTATSGNTTTLTDTTKEWQTNIWTDAVVEIEIGAKKYLTTVSSNTATVLTFPTIGASVIAGCEYSIKIPVTAQNILKWGGTTQTGRDLSLDLKNIAENQAKTTLTMKQIICVASGTEYSYVLPLNARRIEMSVVNGLPGNYFYWSTVTGKVATGLEGSYQVPNNCEDVEDGILFPTGTLYVASSLVGAVIQVKVYS